MGTGKKIKQIRQGSKSTEKIITHPKLRTAGLKKTQTLFKRFPLVELKDMEAMQAMK